MSEMMELDDKQEGSYYHLVSIDNNDAFSQPIVGGSDSKLYRLLTTSNGNFRLFLT